MLKATKLQDSAKKNVDGGENLANINESEERKVSHGGPVEKLLCRDDLQVTLREARAMFARDPRWARVATQRDSSYKRADMFEIPGPGDAIPGIA